MQVGRTAALAAATVACLASAAGAALDRPITVSPGDVAVVRTAPALCPTFSWGGVERARGYELAIYQMEPGAAGEAMLGRRPTVGTEVPGSARSWTPSADRCLQPATRYVWFVRGLGTGSKVSEWSRGGMFRTPEQVHAELPDRAILRMLRQALRAMAEEATADPTTIPRAPLASQPATEEPSGTWQSPAVQPRQSTPSETAFQAEIHDTIGAVTYGVYGISDSDGDDSSGVVGLADAESGDIHGVSGFAYSPEGSGVYGESFAASGGVGVLGVDGPETDAAPSAGVAGVTTNPNGYGGFFWNYAGGDLLAVGNPEVEPWDIKFRVLSDGRTEVAGLLSLEQGIEVGADVIMSGAGIVRFSPLDSPAVCDAGLEGAIYYDLSEAWLCICTKEGPAAFEWRRADDMTDSCES